MFFYDTLVLLYVFIETKLNIIILVLFLCFCRKSLTVQMKAYTVLMTILNWYVEIEFVYFQLCCRNRTLKPQKKIAWLINFVSRFNDVSVHTCIKVDAQSHIIKTHIITLLLDIIITPLVKVRKLYCVRLYNIIIIINVSLTISYLIVNA